MLNIYRHFHVFYTEFYLNAHLGLRANINTIFIIICLENNFESQLQIQKAILNFIGFLKFLYAKQTFNYGLFIEKSFKFKFGFNLMLIN